MRQAPKRQRILPLALLLVGVPALGQHSPDGASTDTAKDAAKNPRFQSAAIAGRFEALPPGPNGFPSSLLMEMRVKLGGEPVPEPAAVAPKPEPETHGH